MNTRVISGSWNAIFKKKILRRGLVLLLALYLLPKVFLFFLICGVIDIARNMPLDKEILKKYFLGNGDITWLLSPLNLFTDLLSWRMKPVYHVNDFPEACQKEIEYLLNHTHKEELIQALDAKMAGKERGMIFFKWYGKNIRNSIQIDDFHQSFKYIKTIGVSAFNKQQSTSRHFGPLRMTLRLLYNFNPVQNEGVYIQVGHHKHMWQDNPLFIFDDTYIHQSFNQSDQIRYCLFVDIVRPSLCFYSILNAMVTCLQFAMIKVNHIFYNKWNFIK